MAVELSDDGHMAKMAGGRIVWFDREGKPFETQRPGDDCFIGCAWRRPTARASSSSNKGQKAF
jgi:hypothetical protein